MKYALYTILWIFAAIAIFSRVTNSARKAACEVCILPIDSFSQATDILKTCNERMLITFDVDDTLITARDVLARVDFPWSFKLFALLKYPELIRRERWEWAASVMFNQADRFVFDQAALSFIQKLRGNACPVVGLTLIETGTFGVVESMEQWRADMLQRLGIDFSGRFEDVIFNTLPAYRGNYPVLYRGILCANQQDKGMVLGSFLDYFCLKLEKIVSFDDNKQALMSIGRECKTRKITFIGYHCLGAQPFISQWDMRKALQQLDYIMQESRWVPDADMLEI